MPGTDCCAIHPTPGCDDPIIEECVCLLFGASHCCDLEWDPICVDLANDCGANCSGCGDGVVGPGEQCDGLDDVACRPGLCQPDCTCSPPPVCGDGVVNQPAEQCDDLDAAACPGLCQPDCTCPPPPVCGDGAVNQPGEECDDGNPLDGDGCSSLCTVEPGFVCSGQPSLCVPFRDDSDEDSDDDADSDEDDADSDEDEEDRDDSSADSTSPSASKGQENETNAQGNGGMPCGAFSPAILLLSFMGLRLMRSRRLSI